MRATPALPRDTLRGLIDRSEEWLVARVLEHAKAQRDATWTATLRAAWRPAVRGYSTALSDFLRITAPSAPEAPDGCGAATEAADAFGRDEARRHRAGGVPSEVVLGLMSCYRAGYLDLLRTAPDLPRPGEAALLIHRFFDRVEIGFHRAGAWRDDEAALADLYRTCVETLDDAVVLIDANQATIQINRTAARLFFEPGPAVADPRSAAPPESWRNRRLEALARSAEDLDVEEWLETAFGTHLFHIRKRRPTAAGDRASGAVLVLRDITARHRTDQALQEAHRSLESHLSRHTRHLRATIDRLTQSNADLERFAYVASHDLQEPLRMVASYTQLLARRYGDLLDDDGRTYVNFAVDGAQRMHDLIEDLLSFARVNTRGASLVACDSGECLIQALHDLGQALGRDKARICVGAMPRVVADPIQLAQLFQNLIGNAVKFRHPEAPADVGVDAIRQGARWRFGIRDRGIGVQEADRERVFAIFQRLHGREAYSGTGIGLAVCKRIVERHGGTIALEETPGGGTTVTFDLAAAAEDGPEGDSGGPPASRPATSSAERR
jgi:signal transduction histidine kinase